MMKKLLILLFLCNQALAAYQPNGVTSTASTVRIESAIVAPSGTGTCTYTQNGSWITSATGNATGDCTINFSPSFSATPTCTMNVVNGNGPGAFMFSAYIVSVGSGSVRFAAEDVASGNTTYSAYGGSVHITCIGPR